MKLACVRTWATEAKEINKFLQLMMSLSALLKAKIK